MVISELLKPNIKKCIIPFILIILFFTMIAFIYSINSVFDEYACERSALIEEYRTYKEENNDVAINQSLKEIKASNKNMKNELEQKLAFKIIKNTAWLFEIGTIIDPIFPAPAPCNSKYTICRYYISEETYNCMQSISTFKEIEEYQKPSLFLIILNALLLFFEGYLISVIISFVYKKIKKD